MKTTCVRNTRGREEVEVEVVAMKTELIGKSGVNNIGSAFCKRCKEEVCGCACLYHEGVTGDKCYELLSEGMEVYCTNIGEHYCERCIKENDIKIVDKVTNFWSGK
jgi:hypothetical protein